MVYITGDTHGLFSRVVFFGEEKKLTHKDTVIVLGDAGINYFGGERDRKLKKLFNRLPYDVFCIHGNHEMRPTDVGTYQTKEYRGGTVWYEPEFPNILFARDGDVFDFDGYKCLVIGGAYSVDKAYRLFNGEPWFINEQPSEEIKAYVEAQLEKLGGRVDIILSHTCPLEYEPKEVFLKGINQLEVDKSTEEWLDKIEKKTHYKKWYCGHFHTEKRIDKIQFMFEDFEVLSTDNSPREEDEEV